MGSRFDVITVETDVLVIGGGLAGCMAAIKAKEHGGRVTIAEKANTKRSGCAGTGIDHLWAYVPQIHEKMGWSLDDLVEDHAQGQGHGWIRKDLISLAARESFGRILDLERFGIKIRYEDSELPGKVRLVRQFHSIMSTINFDGRPLKVKLTDEAKRRGVNIINRVMVTDLVSTDGHISGAIGVSTRSDEIYFFKAKAVVLSTGRAQRLSRNVTSTDFNFRFPPGETGDGKAIALWAGLTLINMEFFPGTFFNVGPIQVSFGAPRSSSWPAGSLTTLNGETIVPKTYFTDWSKYLGEGAKKVDAAERRRKWVKGLKEWPGLNSMHEQGKGPFFLDLTNGTEAEIKYAEWSMGQEGKGWFFLNNLREHGYDLRRDRVEFYPNNREIASVSSAGVWVDKDLETDIKGLFCAGDEIGGVPWFAATGATTTGWHAGDMAAKHAKKQSAFVPTYEEKLEFLEESSIHIRESKNGIPWKEVEQAMQDIMDFYCGEKRTGQGLRWGLQRLTDIKRNVQMKAENPHELMRCLEVTSLMENAVMIMRSSLQREESRPIPFEFYRIDFPNQDDENWFSFLGIKREGAEFKLSKLPIIR